MSFCCYIPCIISNFHSNNFFLRKRILLELPKFEFDLKFCKYLHLVCLIIQFITLLNLHIWKMVFLFLKSSCCIMNEIYVSILKYRVYFTINLFEFTKHFQNIELTDFGRMWVCSSHYHQTNGLSKSDYMKWLYIPLIWLIFHVDAYFHI